MDKLLILLGNQNTPAIIIAVILILMFLAIMALIAKER